MSNTSNESLENKCDELRESNIGLQVENEYLKKDKLRLTEMVHKYKIILAKILKDLDNINKKAQLLSEINIYSDNIDIRSKL